ncbi:BESS domain-containing protein [Aphis craccivora]|uniref:BESS domain-containing protein n=1 Tax=Aphis craccivora TaxID=307492 RepID=A0A6G0YIM9_APHCR|nr:BESS domain-containing protein [Aphis craccivora]
MDYVNESKEKCSTDADKTFVEYFETKRPKLAATASNAKTDSLKQFLNSLIPDLLSMSDMHLRTYKRRSIELIDDILSTPM